MNVEVEQDAQDNVNLNDDINVTLSVAEEFFDAKEIFKDTNLDFDPSYSPMKKLSSHHPKEQILGNPNFDVLTRAHIRARNEVLSVH